jgi:hypothetical protein
MSKKALVQTEHRKRLRAFCLSLRSIYRANIEASISKKPFFARPFLFRCIPYPRQGSTHVFAGKEEKKKKKKRKEEQLKTHKQPTLNGNICTVQYST